MDAQPHTPTTTEIIPEALASELRREPERDTVTVFGGREVLRCHARSKTTGERCKAPAVKGWKVCRMHGARGGRPIITGRSSKAVLQAAPVQDRIDELDISQPFRRAYAMLLALLELGEKFMAEKAGKDVDPNLEHATRLVNDTSRVLKRFHDMMLAEGQVLSAAQVSSIAYMLAEAVNLHVTTCPHCRGDLTDVRRRIAEAWDAIMRTGDHL